MIRGEKLDLFAGILLPDNLRRYLGRLEPRGIRLNGEAREKSRRFVIKSWLFEGLRNSQELMDIVV